MSDGVTLNEKQEASLKEIFDRGPAHDQTTGKVMTYADFRATVKPELGGAAVMVYWCGMWLGIEPDGYVHS